MDWVKVLLFSLVSATVFVESAVAVIVAPPLVAVHVPLMATDVVAPAAMAPVLPLSVVPPMVTRAIVPAVTALVPRLDTATVNVTAAPIAGFGGFVVMLVTW